MAGAVERHRFTDFFVRKFGSSAVLIEGRIQPVPDLLKFRL